MGFLDFSVFSGVLGFRIGGVLSDTFSFGRHGLMAERSLENTLLGCFFFAKFSSTQHTTKTLLSQDLFLSSVFRSYRKGSRQIVQRHRFLKFSFLVYWGFTLLGPVITITLDITLASIPNLLSPHTKMPL